MSGPIDILIGTWSGSGRGFYPTIERFEYTEEVTFAEAAGKPFLTYGQRTRHVAQDRPLHAESGYWRWVGDGTRIEVVLAHPTGVAEILEGSLVTVTGGFDLDLTRRSISLSSTAKDVRSTRRRFELREDVLRYTMSMGAMGVTHQDHLIAELTRR